MSTENRELEEADEVCASCGVAAVDDVKLKKCTCNLVKYCTVDCQKNHRSRHKKACKKRLAELHDKQLFTQPDSSHWGECPICCLPMPVNPKKHTMMACCSKYICKGCSYANKMREFEAGLEQRCAFCREPVPESDEECIKQAMERIKKNDPAVMTQMGKRHHSEGDYRKAVEYWTKAVELGDVAAHFCLGDLYTDGEGVEKDQKKAVYHLEQAAIAGHTAARGLLGVQEMKNGRPERAVKHFIIAANLGCDTSLKLTKEFFVRGIFSKEDYDAALRGHQAAVDASKSAERDEADAFFNKRPN